MRNIFKQKSNYGYLGVFFLFSLMLSLFNIKKTIHCGQDSGCVDLYWADFWLISYSDGYHRRALLGEIIQGFYQDSLSYIVLNGIVFSIVGLILIGLYAFFLKKTNQKERTRKSLIPLFLLVLMSGPSTTLFFETLGDPLHAALLIFIFGVYLLLKVKNNIHYRILFFILTVILLLIHEASLFLIIPSLYVINGIKQNQPINGFLLTAFITVALFIIVLMFDNQVPNKSSLGLQTTSQIYHLQQNALPSFWFLLKKEAMFYFGSKEGMIIFLFKLVSPFFWPIFVLLAFSHYLKQPKLIFLFLFLFLFSLPLYVIAHDWGRFSIYTFWLTLFVWSQFEWQQKSVHLFPKPIQRISLLVYKKTKPMFVSKSVLFLPVISFYAYPEYRIYGLSHHNAVLIFCGTVLFLVFKAWCKKNAPNGDFQ